MDYGLWTVNIITMGIVV